MLYICLTSLSEALAQLCGVEGETNARRQLRTGYTCSGHVLSRSIKNGQQDSNCVSKYSEDAPPVEIALGNIGLSDLLDTNKYILLFWLAWLSGKFIYTSRTSGSAYLREVRREALGLGLLRRWRVDPSEASTMSLCRTMRVRNLRA